MLKNMSILKKYNTSIVYCIIICCIAFICFFLADVVTYKKRFEFSIPNYIILPFGIMAYLCVFWVSKWFLKIKTGKIILIFTIIFNIILIFYTQNYCFKTGWDVERALNNAQKIANGSIDELDNKYYSRYPNNILLTQLYASIFKLSNVLNIENGYALILFIQCFIYAWTGYVLFKILQQLIKNERIAIMGWVIYIMLIGLSPWVIIPYSDSLGLGIISLLVFLLLKSIENPNKNKSMIFASGFIALSIIGFYIKPQLIIVLIAVVLIEILYKIKCIHKYIKQICIYSVVAIITFLAIHGVEQMSGFSLDKEKKFGVAHFLMMGWNSVYMGSYGKDDVAYSAKFETRKERDMANIEKFKERIYKIGPRGVGLLILQKTLLNYNDGTFAYGREGNFFKEDYQMGNLQVRSILNKIYKSEGKYYGKFQLFMQIIWMGTLFFNIFSYSKENDKRIKIIQLSIIGLTLFELLFEARARYLLAYAPLYILLATLGFYNVINYLKNKFAKNKISFNNNLNSL